MKPRIDFSLFRKIFPLFLLFLIGYVVNAEGIKMITEPTGIVKFDNEKFPDGMVGKSYNFVLTSVELVLPYIINFDSGMLPPGLNFDQYKGIIDGEPNKSGEYKFTIKITDSQGKTGIITDNIKVWQRVLTVGEHGNFKGIDGFQMALNMAQDMDEIRIEQGNYEGSGVAIPEGKAINLLKISGGWDKNFDEKDNTRYTTVFDAKKKPGNILSINLLKGGIIIENIGFANSGNTAVYIMRDNKIEEKKRYIPPNISFINCSFNNNSSPFEGGAVDGYGEFINCLFANNSAVNGGAIRGGGYFKNCMFSNNSAGRMLGAQGGAFYGSIGVFVSCIFVGNKSSDEGGAIYGSGYLINYYSAKDGGKIYGKESYIKCYSCIFTENKAYNTGGAISGNSGNGRSLFGCLLYNNSARYGGAIYNIDNKTGVKTESIINCTFFGNNAEFEGGAIAVSQSFITNSIFYGNKANGKENDIASISTGMNMQFRYCLINYVKGPANLEPSNIIGDPKFINTQMNDFHLRSDSPCVDSGENINETQSPYQFEYFDIDGKRRVVGEKIDIGSYEYQGVDESLNITSQALSVIGRDGAKMVLIPSGEFRMGSNDGSDDEKPVHTVYIDAFYMDQYEVTNAQYRIFMNATGHKAPKYWNDPNSNDPKQPVIGVSWDDAVAYAKWAGKRLPTEAEWEKAARGGLSGKRYPWGDDISHDDANYNGTNGKDVWTCASPVGSFAPNGYGLYDMTGNVWEWCADWYDSEYYSNSPKSNPPGPDSGTFKVIRGGSCYNDNHPLRVAARFSYPANACNYFGFRCVSIR